MADFSKIHGSMDPKNDAKWVSYVGTDIEFLIAPMNNPAFTNKVQVNTKIGVSRENESMLKITQEEVKHFIGTIVLDWKNVEVEGEAWEWTEKNALKLFSAYPQVINWIVSESQEIEKTFTDKLDADKKK